MTTDWPAARARMVETQIAARGISDPAILAAFRAVPREEFVPEEARASAYDDGPLPIAAEQTISQPYIVAVMIAAAAIGPADRVLEIGAGSGYAAAVLAQIAGAVVAIERHHELAVSARARVEAFGYINVAIVEGDGTQLPPDQTGFDAILVSASGPGIPVDLLNRLRTPQGRVPGGRLVMPVGAPGAVQRLIKNVRTSHDVFAEEDLGAVRFVPLIGARGWAEQ